MNCPHWLLALTIPFSRSDRAHTSPAGVGAGCARRTVPDDCSAGESPSAVGGPWEAVPTGCHRSRPPRSVNAFCSGAKKARRARTALPGRSANHPGSELATLTRCGAQTRYRGPSRTRGSLRGRRPAHGSRQDPVIPRGDRTALERAGGHRRPSDTGRGMRRATWTLARHPALEAQRAFRSSHPIALGPPGGSVRCPLISSIYRSCANSRFELAKS